MSCPDYYLLTSGRDFLDFANTELATWLKPRVSHEVYHCLISAMEHRFRCGNKEGETETDRIAEQFWLTAAYRLMDKGELDHARRIVYATQMMVDYERKLKVDRSW